MLNFQEIFIDANRRSPLEIDKTMWEDNNWIIYLIQNLLKY